MSEAQAPRARGEQGAALILAIAFLLVVSAISAAVVSTITSGLNDRASLNQARDREYSADGAIETSITRLRNTSGADCGATAASFTFNDPQNHDPKKPTIHVDCVSTPRAIITTDPFGTLFSFPQNDVTFTACVSAAASVNYASGPASGSLTVSSSTAGFSSSGVVNVNGATQGVFAYTSRTGNKFNGVTTIQAGSALSGVVTQGCSSATTIIKALVNFQGTSLPLSTFVQAWSVNG